VVVKIAFCQPIGSIELAARDPKAKVGVSVFCQPTWVNKLAARDPKAKEGVSVAKHKH